jgi:hypothetical protein
MTFENLPPLLDEALTARGYTALTPVQSAVMTAEAEGRDLVVSAQTGSGKTVAFGLAMAPQILDGGLVSLAREPAALIIAPTRELALQVSRELMWLYAKAGVRIATCVGGMDASKERRTLNQGAQIVVGTPGRLRDHLERGALDLSALKVAILDEADEMLDMGFREELEEILNATPEGRRSLRHPAPWLGAVLAGVIVLPVLLWNAQNGWASFLFQAARSQGAGFSPWLVPASLLAQAGWLLPWVFVPLVCGLWLGWRSLRDRRFGFLMALAMPSIAVFTLTPAFGNLGLPHWAMPGWFFVMPLAGLALARLAETGPRAMRWARISALGSVIVLALLAGQAATGWLGRIIPNLPRHDPTLETFGWDQLRGQLEARQISLDHGRFIMADSWQNAGRIDVALAGSMPVMPGTGDPRHYAFIIDQTSLIGRDAVVIVRARREALLRQQLASHFESLGPGQPIRLGRGGQVEIELVAIVATGFAKPLPWAYGLHP